MTRKILTLLVCLMFIGCATKMSNMEVVNMSDLELISKWKETKGDAVKVMDSAERVQAHNDSNVYGSSGVRLGRSIGNLVGAIMVHNRAQGVIHNGTLIKEEMIKRGINPNDF
jgi:hypothetical protein